MKGLFQAAQGVDPGKDWSQSGPSWDLLVHPTTTHVPFAACYPHPPVWAAKLVCMEGQTRGTHGDPVSCVEVLVLLADLGSLGLQQKLFVFKPRDSADS